MPTIPHLSADECYSLLHKAGWSIGEAVLNRGGLRLWMVFGCRDGQKILGRALAQTDAWRAAVMAAESARFTSRFRHTSTTDIREPLN